MRQIQVQNNVNRARQRALDRGYRGSRPPQPRDQCLHSTNKPQTIPGFDLQSPVASSHHGTGCVRRAGGGIGAICPRKGSRSPSRTITRRYFQYRAVHCTSYAVHMNTGISGAGGSMRAPGRAEPRPSRQRADGRWHNDGNIQTFSAIHVQQPTWWSPIR